ncbi:hypothetical protein PF010_g6013 [Phytophthora fragariae]|nr:hypothetical protein PF010_g6013 [Phytophthora fragariae]KAE9243733.1 hypothetical protein PF004_g6002 [Phytophthora fragariae]
MATQAPVTVSVSAPVAIPVATDAPAAVPVSTDAPIPAATDAPVAAPVAIDTPVPISTEAPVSVAASTNAPVTVATDAPGVVSVSTTAPVVVPTTAPITTAPATQAPSAATQAPAVATQVPAPPTPAADSPTPTAQSSSMSGAQPDRDIADESPAATGSSSTEAAVVVPDESTAAPLATARPPVVNTGSADTSPGTPAAGTTTSPDSPSAGPGSLDSSRNNETVLVSSESGSEDNSDVMTPGHVHASSSADVSLDGSSDELGFGSSDTGHGGKQKKDKKKQDARNSSSGDHSANSSKGGASKLSSTSNSGGSKAGSNGFGGILNPGGVSDVNTSSATYYSLGTGSIVAIVGVIASIAGVLVLFVAISRKKYSDDDGESPLPYGVDIRSVARLSPTFMQDDSFMESGYNGTALMVAVPPPTNQFDGSSSTSGESCDEVPSLRGYMMNASHCDPLADISMRSRVPIMMSFSGEGDAGNVRTSALYSAGSSVASSSAISGSWSSVLESDTERQTMRNTRDTSLSAWSATNLSSFGSTASGASGLHRLTRSSSTLSAEIRHTGGSDRSRGYSGPTLPPPQEEEATRVAAGEIDSSRSNASTEV